MTGENKDKKEKGRNKKGQFVSGSNAAIDAGRKGGRAAQRSGNAHKFTTQERRTGGQNSRSRHKDR